MDASRVVLKGCREKIHWNHRFYQTSAGGPGEKAVTAILQTPSRTVGTTRRRPSRKCHVQRSLRLSTAAVTKVGQKEGHDRSASKMVVTAGHFMALSGERSQHEILSTLRNISRSPPRPVVDQLIGSVSSSDLKTISASGWFQFPRL